MRRFLKLISVSLFAGSLTVCVKAEEPVGQVIGYYSNGKIFQATALPMSGPGFIHLFQDRNRHFGSEGLIQVIETVSSRFFSWDPNSERLQIGDIAAEAGGQISRHASHQNGLDIDVVYFRTNRQEQNLNYTDGFEEAFVTPKGQVTPNFDTQRNWRFFQFLMDSGRVDRIFVDPAIKRTLCTYAKTPLGVPPAGPQPDVIETLRHLRPYPNHADHAHVRLTCPDTSPKCIAQVAVPPGDGCSTIDADLFSASLLELGE